MKTLALAILLAACGGATAAPASSAPSTSNDCPATLNCQPPTNDKNPVCQLPDAERQKRCPNTRFLD